MVGQEPIIIWPAADEGKSERMVNTSPGPEASFTDSTPLGEERAADVPKLFTMKIKILCTLGPASLRGDVIRALEERGVDLFRINLSHTPPEAVEPTIALIRRYSNVPICLDSQGAQVRCGKMAEGTTLAAGTTITICADDVSARPSG